MNNSQTNFPKQKISSSKKTKEWYKKCIEGAEALAVLGSGNKDDDHYRMQVLEDLSNDILDQKEIEKVFNPMQLEGATFPAAIKNYALSVPKIDLLVGEELKRKFDWSVVSTSNDVVSAKNDALRDEIIKQAVSVLKDTSLDEESFQKNIEKTAKYFKYDYKELRELYATSVLQYLWHNNNSKIEFNNGFREALIKGKEIYRISNVGGEPTLKYCDPKNVYPLRLGDSYKIEDADIIVEITYEPIGTIIDEFYDYLTPADIDKLEEGAENFGIGVNGTNNVSTIPTLLVSNQIGSDGTYDDNLNSITGYSLPFNANGNIRVLRVRWRGRRKIGKLTYLNEFTGNEENRLVSEYYKVNKDLGESIKWIWINEAYEGVRVGADIYLKMQPCEVQTRHFDNPSKCFLGYVGSDYGKSLMERMEPYQYLYNVYMRRIELFFARYHGPITEWDLSKKPDNWSEDMWLYYGDVLGKLIIDPFNEGKKGSSTGKLAGSFNTTGRILDAGNSNYVQQLLMMLQHIESSIGRIAGIPEQREGQIQSNETVGGVERVVTQSSHITERWYSIHYNTLKRALSALLDTAKVTWKTEKSKKLTYFLDDMAQMSVNINCEDLASSEYDLFISDSSDDLKIKQVIEQLANAYVQNGGSLTLPIKILRSDSISQMAQLIEEGEEQNRANQQEMEKRSLEANQAMKQAELEDKKADRELEYYKINKDAEVKLMIANKSPEEDHTIEKEKISLQEEKQKNEQRTQEKELALKNKELEETKRSNKAKEKIASNNKNVKNEMGKN